MAINFRVEINTRSPQKLAVFKKLVVFSGEQVPSLLNVQTKLKMQKLCAKYKN